MAASPHHESRQNQSELENIIDGILVICDNCIGTNLKFTCRKIAACRRRGDADILLPFGGKKTPSAQEIAKLCKDLTDTYQGCKLRLQEISLLISLHRPSSTRRFLQPVISQKHLYGFNKIGENKTVAVWSGGVCDLRDYSKYHVELDDLRALHVASHLVQLLQANGYNVHSDCNRIQQDLCCNRISNMEDLIGKLKASKYGIKTEGTQIFLDMIAFIRDENLPLGKNNYSINLKESCKEVGISCDSSLLQLTARMDHSIKDHFRGVVDVHVHVVPHRKHLRREMSDILWNMAANEHAPRVFCDVGSAVIQGSNDVLFSDELYRIRLRQVEKAFLLKRESTFGNLELTEDVISTVADASLKMELLSVSQTSPVTLNTCEKGAFHSNGVFVMYNYVRVQSVLDSFEKSVNAGVYPCLQPFDEVDTSLLTLEEEWNLIVNYLAKFPSIVKEISHTMTSLQHVRNVFPTSKICHFLDELSKDFSSYYSRVHILGEPAPHLFQRMFARIWLLLALKQIFLNCFSLLNIEPPAYM